MRVAIWGSCVSRDTLDLGGMSDFSLVRYIARQSMLSAGTDCRHYFPSDLALPSSFQQRNIESDLRGDALAQLAEVATQVDVLIVDLVDERHGVSRFEDATVATRSVEILSNPRLNECLEQGERLPLGTDQHFEIWRDSAGLALERLHDLGILEKTLLISVPWASSSLQGSPTPPSMGQTAEMANAAYARYYSLLEAQGMPSVVVGSARADESHRWGFAPFHYDLATYSEIAGRIRLAVQSGVRER